MKKAINIKNIQAKKQNTTQDHNYICLFSCVDGICSIETNNSDVAGIQIEFSGKANIIPKVPEGWIFRGLGNKIIIFSLDRKVLSSGILFSYIGKMTLKNVIVSDINAKVINSIIKKSSHQFGAQNWNWNEQDLTFDELKDRTVSFTKVSKTKFNMKADIALVAKQGEFFLGNKPYTGAYHIPHDTNIPMTGAQFNKNSKPLSKNTIEQNVNINAEESTNGQGGY